MPKRLTPEERQGRPLSERIKAIDVQIAKFREEREQLAAILEKLQRRDK